MLRTKAKAFHIRTKTLDGKTAVKVVYAFAVWFCSIIGWFINM